MPTSMPGIGTPATPSAPPSAMTSGKVTGSSQIAGAAEEGAPEADGDHRGDMVPAEDRVQEAGGEATAGGSAGMGGGRGGEGEDAGERQGRAQGSGLRCGSRGAHHAPMSRLRNRLVGTAGSVITDLTLVAGIGSFDDVRMAARQDGGDLLLELVPGDLRLRGVGFDDIGTGNFLV